MLVAVPGTWKWSACDSSRGRQWTGAPTSEPRYPVALTLPTSNRNDHRGNDFTYAGGVDMIFWDASPRPQAWFAKKRGDPKWGWNTMYLWCIVIVFLADFSHFSHVTSHLPTAACFQGPESRSTETCLGSAQWTCSSLLVAKFEA